jgi:hypothetical protein
MAGPRCTRRSSERLEKLDAALEHAGRGPTPTGVQGSHRPTLRIDYEHGHAIRRGHGQQHPRRVSDMSVTVVDQMRILHARTDPPVEADLRSMHLMSVDDPLAPQTLPQRAPPPPRRLRLASVREQSEVEGVVVPGLPRRRALNEPGEGVRPLRMDERAELGFADLTDHAERRGVGRCADHGANVEKSPNRLHTRRKMR